MPYTATQGAANTVVKLTLLRRSYMRGSYAERRRLFTVSVTRKSLPLYSVIQDQPLRPSTKLYSDSYILCFTTTNRCARLLYHSLILTYT